MKVARKQSTTLFDVSARGWYKDIEFIVHGDSNTNANKIIKHLSRPEARALRNALTAQLKRLRKKR